MSVRISQTNLLPLGALLWGASVFGGGGAMAAPSAPDATFDLDGVHYDVRDGMLYQGPTGGVQQEVQRVYDPDFYAKNFGRDGDRVVRIGANGERYPVKMDIDEGFENAPTIATLVGIDRGWTDFTLLGPAARSPADYSKLRQRILSGKGDFIDNRVEPSTIHAHLGHAALRTSGVAANMQVSKASLTSGLVHYRKGDDFWYSAWYFLEKGRPWSLVDLESSFLDQGGGMRLMLTDDLRPYFQLKWPSRPEYRTNPGNNVTLKSGVWTHIKIHFLLSEGSDGRSQLWVDDNLVIDAHGVNLPVSKIVYDSLEIGLTSIPPSTETILYVDDVKVSHDELF